MNKKRLVVNLSGILGLILSIIGIIYFIASFEGVLLYWQGKYMAGDTSLYVRFAPTVAFLFPLTALCYVAQRMVKVIRFSQVK